MRKLRGVRVLQVPDPPPDTSIWRNRTTAAYGAVTRTDGPTARWIYQVLSPTGVAKRMKPSDTTACLMSNHSASVFWLRRDTHWELRAAGWAPPVIPTRWPGCTASPNRSLKGVGNAFLSLCIKTIVYRDRLQTNIGKVEKQCVFVQAVHPLGYERPR